MICEGLHNEDDCLIWRAQNGFDARFTNYDPCGDEGDASLVAGAEEGEINIEKIKEEVLKVKPAAGPAE